MPKKDTERLAYRSTLKMMAVQLAGEFPANRKDALFVLRRIQKILDENVYDEEEALMRATSGEVVPFTVLSRDDRAS